MIKNIILFLLAGAVVFLLILNVNFKKDAQNQAKQTQQSDKSSAHENIKISGKSLDLSNQGLERLPSYALEDSSLEALDISNNKLSGALPGEIRRLKNLKILDVSNNQMTGIPAELGQLENLEILDLSNNKFTGLPYELGNLKNLKKLNLSGNNYANQDLEIIKKNLPANIQIIL